jgi:hypothetical protein
MFVDNQEQPASTSAISVLEETDADWSTSHPVIVPGSPGNGKGGTMTGGTTGGAPGLGAPAAGGAWAMVYRFVAVASNLQDYEWMASASRIKPPLLQGLLL